MNEKIKQLEEQLEKETVWHDEAEHIILKQQKVIDEIIKLLKSKQIVFKDKRVGFTHISETELQEILAQLEKKE